jgi:hypothetical protein
VIAACALPNCRILNNIILTIGLLQTDIMIWRAVTLLHRRACFR